MIGSADALRTYFQSIGAPYLPHFRLVNARNVRSVFHRYNSKVNRGLQPPLSVPPELPQADTEEAKATESTPTKHSASPPTPDLPSVAEEDTYSDSPEWSKHEESEKGSVSTAKGAAASEEKKEADGNQKASASESERRASDAISDDPLEMERLQQEKLRSFQNENKDALELFKDHELGPDIWLYPQAMCCCQYRSLGTMEM